MPDHRVVDFLCMHLPFAPEEKQSLLEAPDTRTRAAVLVTVVQMVVRTDVDAGNTRH